MKQLFIFAAFIFAATFSQAQSDSIVKNAIQVVPKVYNTVLKDTLTQLGISVFDLKVGDTTAGCNSFVVFYDRKAASIGAINVAIPASVVNKWGTDDKVIEDHILTFLGLKRK